MYIGAPLGDGSSLRAGPTSPWFTYFTEASSYSSIPIITLYIITCPLFQSQSYFIS